MLFYVLKRLLAMLPIVLVVTFLAFTFGEYGSIDIAAYLTIQQNVEGRMDMDAYRAMRERLGLDDPLLVRYARWLGGAVRGDFGISYVTIGQPSVSFLIERALPVSLQMGIAALLVALALGLPLGILTAVYRNSAVDYVVVGISTLISSTPSFVLAPIAMIVLVAQLKLIPQVGLGWDGGLSSKSVLPVLVLAAGSLVGIIRFTRASVLEVLSQEYIRAARARGLSQWQVIRRHVIKNALTPILTILGLGAAGLLSGSLFVERIFNLPGLGMLAGDAFLGGDVQTAVGVIFVSSLLIMTINLIVDLLYALVDPRVRLAK
jgi:ABC-type dipeptide/oligopeptide/nickel transport system permease component